MRDRRPQQRLTGFQFDNLCTTVGHRIFDSAPFDHTARTVKCFTPYFIASCPKTVGQENSRTNKLSAATLFILNIPLRLETHATRHVMHSHQPARLS